MEEPSIKKNDLESKYKNALQKIVNFSSKGITATDAVNRIKSIAKEAVENKNKEIK